MDFSEKTPSNRQLFPNPSCENIPSNSQTLHMASVSVAVIIPEYEANIGNDFLILNPDFPLVTSEVGISNPIITSQKFKVCNGKRLNISAKKRSAGSPFVGQN